MTTLALIGGIGSGKSTVAEMFCQLGALRIDADDIGHDVLLRADVQAEIRRRWGEKAFDATGRPDRRKIAAIVFGPSERSSQELVFLQSITHPRIADEVRKQLRQFSSSRQQHILFDAPLLLEAGWERLVDRIVFVDAPRPVRLRRVLERGWTESEWDAREKAQLDLEIKRRHADFFVDNSGSPAKTLEHVRAIWAKL